MEVTINGCLMVATMAWIRAGASPCVLHASGIRPTMETLSVKHMEQTFFLHSAPSGVQ
jgi:hypothetical protein